MLVLSVVVSLVVFPKLDLEDFLRDQTLKRAGGLSDSQLAEQVAIQMKFASAMQWVNLVFFVVGCALTALLFMGLLKLIGGHISFKTSFSVLLHALMPRALVATILSIPVALSQSEISTASIQTRGVLASNLGWLAGKDAPQWLMSLLGSFDLFSFWTIGLLIVGYSITARCNRGAAAGVVLSAWAFWILLKVGLASIGP